MKGLLIAIVLLIIAGGAYALWSKDKDMNDVDMMDDTATTTEEEMADTLADDIIEEVEEMQDEMEMEAEASAEAEATTTN